METESKLQVNGQDADPTQVELMKEKCILVNELDEVIGADTKENCHRGEGKLHRAFSVFLFNSNNELLLQCRSDKKITFPLHWANTCCSHPLYCEGELEGNQYMGVKRAAIRKLEQELGISPNAYKPADFHFLTKVLYKARSDDEWCEHEVDYVLLIKADVDLKVNPNEVAEVKYLSLDEINSFIDDPSKKISPWFKLIKDNLLPEWWKKIETVKEDSKENTIIRFYD